MTIIHAYIDYTAALAAGHNVTGHSVAIDIDVAEVPEDLRAALAARVHQANGQLVLHNSRSIRMSIPAATAEALLDAVRRDVAAVAEANQERAAKVVSAITQILAASDADLMSNWSHYNRAPTMGWLSVYDDATYRAVTADPQVGGRLVPIAASKDAEARAQKERDASEWAAVEQRAAAEMVSLEAERAQWIAAHGSPRLQRLVAESIEHDAVYHDERLAFDRPDWQWQPKKLYTNQPRNPPQEALDLLDEARTSDPEAALAYYLLYRAADGNEDGDEDGEILAERGYVATATYLGRYTVSRNRVVID